MDYYLGIDQGGSKTEAIVFTGQGEILAFADDRGMRKPGESYAQKQGEWLRCAANRAAQKAGISLAQLSGSCCALNGADWPEDYIRLQELVSCELGIPAASILIVNDCIGAMRGGAYEGNRAVLCLGTGMNTAVQAKDGREYIYGFFANAPDQGGGALGTKAWQSILDAYNGLGPSTRITPIALEAYGEDSLVALYKKFTSSKIIFRNYDFSPLLMKAAKQEDAVALEILRNAAHRFVQYIHLGAKKLGISGQNITLVLTGGVFKGDGDILFQMIEQNISQNQYNIQCTPAKYEPVAGSCMLLLDSLGKPQHSPACEKFRSMAGQFGVTRL